MRWSTPPDAATFLEVAGSFLRLSPLENQVPLSLSAGLLQDPLRYSSPAHPGPARLHIVLDGKVLDGERCVGTVLQTPPHPPTLSRMAPSVATFAGERFRADHPDVNGAFGPEEVVEGFLAGAFPKSFPGAGAGAFSTQRMGLFALRAVTGLWGVTGLPRPPGRRRLAVEADAGLLQGWLQAFHDEAVPRDPPVAADAGARAARGYAHLWVDEIDGGEVPVALACFGRKLEGFVSVGPVYTPPEHRGHGYATALVAEMSSLALATGQVGCTLFTDLSNPTSNRIYERIGYKRIGTMARSVLGG